MKNKFKSTAISNGIMVYGAKEHNLKNIDVFIPKNTLTVITGPSGSGKSSLALDILFTEGKRRYVESLSSYVRQFLGIAKKPNVDRIDGLCPSIAIEQKTVGKNPRSTVGTITEIYDYLRVLFARVGIVNCPDCNVPIQSQSADVITQIVMTQFANYLITIVAPFVRQKKGEFVVQLQRLFDDGLYRFIINGNNYKFSSHEDIKALQLKKTHTQTIDIVIDAFIVTDQERVRLQEAVEHSFKYADGICKVLTTEGKEYLYSSYQMCLHCSRSVPVLEPRFFSFNSPVGACQKCHGIGTVHEWPWGKGDANAWKSGYPLFFGDKYAQIHTCNECFGKRLHKDALAVTIEGKTIYDLTTISIEELLLFFNTVQFDEKGQEIAGGLIAEIIKRVTFLHDVGLSYLTLARTARTLSGGEGQRIRLATQIGSALSGVLYILDEPSIGLHQRDNDKLIETLKTLRDQGNTVVVVEHDIDTIKQADYVIDMGPAAGILGGTVTAYGTPAQLAKNSNSVTGAFLSGKRTIVIPETVRKPHAFITIANASTHNLQNITAQFPLGVLCGVSGVSGSGKSTLVMQELLPAIQREFSGGYTRKKNRGQKPELLGAESLENLVVIDQSPIGRTPRSNPATYLGIFDEIRKLFIALPESNIRGYTIGRFSFNVKEGRCFECSGDGSIKVEMHFLPDVTMQCKACNGKRYSSETLSIRYKNKTIADVLAMTIYEARIFFANHKRIVKRLDLLCDVGLDYIALGQPSTTLSGGEAQRIKLVDELAKRGNNTLYILDEPTTGLHNSDIEKLLQVLNRLVDKGNSMIIIEHNLDVLKTVDYIIDLGPEGGDKGGIIVAHGTPKKVSQNKNSHTGQYLKPFF